MMKRFILFLLTLLLLSGCASSGNNMTESVTFYYLRHPSNDSIYDDFFAEGVIGSEIRDVSGRESDLNYLLAVYFRGPLESGLVSPFPAGCKVLEIHENDGELFLLLNSVWGEKNDMDVTLACACLAKTCLDFTDAETVRIESKNPEDKLLFSRVFTGDNLFLSDDYTHPVENTENNP